jgi:plasmid maintenance system antidote protein VapI
MSTTMTEQAFQGPGHQEIVRLLLLAMEEKGLNQTELAKALRLDKTAVSKMLSGNRNLTAVEFGMAAAVTGWSPNQLMGIEPRRAETTWNPLFQEPKDLLKVWATHQSRRNEIIAFDHNVVCSATTQVVHEKRDARLFEPLTWTDEGRLILQRFGEFARMRRERYLTTNESTAPKITSLMLRSDFERLVNRNEPYQDCSAMEVWNCMSHLRDECVDARGFRLILLDERKIDLKLRQYIAGIDSLAVIGGTLVVTRGINFSISFFDNQVAVREGLDRMRMLLTCAGLDVDAEIPKAKVLKVIDEYCVRAKDQMHAEISATRKAK